MGRSQAVEEVGVWEKRERGMNARGLEAMGHDSEGDIVQRKFVRG